MPLYGALFLSELVKKPVFDPEGEVLGRVKDIIVVKGDPLPQISTTITERKKELFQIKWKDVDIFNKRIISSEFAGWTASNELFGIKEYPAVPISRGLSHRTDSERSPHRYRVDFAGGKRCDVAFRADLHAVFDNKKELLEDLTNSKTFKRIAWTTGVVMIALTGMSVVIMFV
ncbi:MAG: PRC-barrel domain-containing protein [Thermodesulfovibrionales bacterium]|jgi:sporulation protein YlmC with PRC-barrel domain